MCLNILGGILLSKILMDFFGKNSAQKINIDPTGINIMMSGNPQAIR